MPAQKRPLEEENTVDPPPIQEDQQQQQQQQQNEVVVNGDDNGKQHQDEDEVDEEDGDDDDDDDDSDEEEQENGGELISLPEVLSSDYEDDDDTFVLVRLSDIRKEVQCPICLGIIRKTRTVMECLHRFCRECIDKSMRMGNNECPACRTHCASRRSLRDDPNYDALISTIYPDIDKYEEEELAFQEDERVRNKQIQAAIAETIRRQTEALSKKRRRSQGNYRRRNFRSEEEDDTNGNDVCKDSSSADERLTEPKPKRPKRWRSQPSQAAGSGDGGGDENDMEVQREVGPAPTPLVGSAEMLAWGKGGIRSSTRYGSGSGGNGKHSRSRLARLNELLRNSGENDNEMDIQVVLVSLDQQKEPLLEHSYLCGKPAISVGQLCQVLSSNLKSTFGYHRISLSIEKPSTILISTFLQFIALQTSLPPEKVEILAARGRVQTSTSTTFEASKDELQVLDPEETLAGLKDACNFARGHLLLAYRQKL